MFFNFVIVLIPMTFHEGLKYTKGVFDASNLKNWSLLVLCYIYLYRMMNENKIAQYNIEMAVHANGAAQYLSAMLGGGFVTREQIRDMVDYMFAATKRNIESCPSATQEQKDAEIHRRELLLNSLKPLMGL